ncbi:hypothetical protein ABZ532_19880 [Streptomyces sp. NPDC019396]|uniref:hypothetical protein n=1 Tax=Streptomyces sp. NPDC019396 TaxID=3154687 RepID=UPI0033E5AB0E
MALRSVRGSKRRTGETREPGNQSRRSGRTVDSSLSLPTDASLPPTADWLLRGKDGRLTAYAPGADCVLRWTETQAGADDWIGPERFPAPGILPYLAIAQGSDGYVQLVGLRRTPLAGGQVATDVVQAIQYQSGRPMREWYALGTPYQDRELAARIGLPAAVVDAEGSLHVFVRNAGGGVCGRAQVPNGKWNKWADFKGSDMLGVPSASLTDHGHMEVLAPTAEIVMRWVQETPGVKFQRADDVKNRVAESSMSSERTGRERLSHAWRDAATGAVHVWREGMTPVSLGGDGGTGPVAMLRTPVDGVDCTILAQRGKDGRAALAAYPTEDESAGAAWTSTGDPCVGVPALAIDGNGRVVLAALGADGSLRVTRQKAESGLAMEPWTVIRTS